MNNYTFYVDGVKKAGKVDFAETYLERSNGLLGRESLSLQEGIFWEVTGFKKYLCGYWNAIHMVGMKFPITVAWLDKNQRVLKVVIARTPSIKNILGWHSCRKPASYVVELHTDLIGSVPVGSVLSWEKNRETQ